MQTKLPTKTPPQKQVPDWVQKRKVSLSRNQNKLFLFPEGETEIVIDMSKEPQSVDFGTEERPQIKSVYTATINGKVERFVPNKRMESVILDCLAEGNNHLIVNRVGKDMENTKYTIKAFSA